MSKNSQKVFYLFSKIDSGLLLDGIMPTENRLPARAGTEGDYLSLYS